MEILKDGVWYWMINPMEVDLPYPVHHIEGKIYIDCEEFDLKDMVGLSFVEIGLPPQCKVNGKSVGDK